VPAAGAGWAPTGVEYHCERAWQDARTAEGYQYADAPAFWLGSQAPRSLAVDGLGHLVLGQAEGEPPARRYARQLAFLVGPDGTLEDPAGRALLGYPPGGDTTGECMTPLRVPFLAPPRATTAIAIQANLDSRQAIQTFDILDPEGTSGGFTTVGVWDSQGGAHTLYIYFSNQGGNLYQVNVVVDGGELAGGTPGVPTLIGTGWLQFMPDGSLYEDQLSTLDVSFVSGLANQPIDIDFGASLQEGDFSGLTGTTGFAWDLAVFAQSQDGLPPGVGSEVTIDGWGNVQTRFDNGATLAGGRLAIARFPREAKLSRDADGVWRETFASGEPLFGRPLEPGRGSVRSD
jgi:flagellar hook protein FlgE